MSLVSEAGAVIECLEGPAMLCQALSTQAEQQEAATYIIQQAGCAEAPLPGNVAFELGFSEVAGRSLENLWDGQMSEQLAVELMWKWGV